MLAGRGWLHSAAFDLLWLNGRDLRSQALTRRKRRLEGLIPTNNRVFAVEEHGRELFEAAQRLHSLAEPRTSGSSSGSASRQA